MSYTKLFRSILDSSIWLEPNTTKIVWITMLAMKDRDGVVEASVKALARRAGVSVEETKQALATLTEPDEDSRTPEYEGRRIVKVDGGWHILNSDKYREKQDEHEQRERKNARQARWRARVAKSLVKSPGVDANVDARSRLYTTEDRSEQSRSEQDQNRVAIRAAGLSPPRVWVDQGSGSQI